MNCDVMFGACQQLMWHVTESATDVMCVTVVCGMMCVMHHLVRLIYDVVKRRLAVVSQFIAADVITCG